MRHAEALLGYKLPRSYIRLLQSRNGGTPVRDCFPTATPTSWANDHIAHSGIRGIGGKWSIDSADIGTIPMIREWGSPDMHSSMVSLTAAGMALWPDISFKPNSLRSSEES